MTSETQDLANFTPNVVLASTWDSNNNRLTLAATLGSNADFKNTYTYDYLNRMTKVIQEGQSGGNTLATKRVDFAYNGLGQFTTIDRYQNTAGTNIVAQTTFAYDDDNRLTDLDHKQGITTLAGYDYGYDNMGRITSITSTVEGASTFTYDKTSQLTGADHASPRSDETYTYDDNGNRTMSGYTVAANNLTTSDGTYDYEYDDEGNRTKRTEISSGNYEVYEWDHRNRLISVTFYDSLDTETKSVDHTYDIFNRWLRRTTDPDGPGGSSATDTYFTGYDGIHATLQFDGSADTDLTNRYLFGPAVDQILASEDVTSLGSAGNILWALSDHLGTPRDIADQNEGTYTTTVTNHRTYNSFGKRTAETNTAVDLLFGETGKAFDEDTGLGNHLGRWLDPDLSQWLSRDPTAFYGGDVNLRRYVGNTPTMFVDPDGFQAQLPFSLVPPNMDATSPAYQQWYMLYMIHFYIANPIMQGQVTGNWLDHMMDFGYGFSDIATLGIAPAIRWGIGYNPPINRSSPWYWGGAALPIVIVTAGAAVLPSGIGAAGATTTIIGTAPRIGVAAAAAPVASAPAAPPAAAAAGSTATTATAVGSGGAPTAATWTIPALKVQLAAAKAELAATQTAEAYTKVLLFEEMIKQLGGTP